MIAIGCDAMIVNAAALGQDSADMIFDLYSQIDGCTNETVIWLGALARPEDRRALEFGAGRFARGVHGVRVPELLPHSGA